MKKLKSLVALALCLSMALALVACAPSAPSPAPQEPAQQNEASAPAAEAPAQQGEPAPAGEPVTIRVDVQPFASPQTLPRIAELIAEFEKANNIKVELTVSVNDDPYRVKLLQDVAAGNAADVCFIDGGWLMEFDVLDALVPLDKWFTPELQSRFIDFAIEGGTINGELKSIWFHTGSSGLYYRKDLLEEAGYSAPPKTWNELTEMAKKLTVDPNGDGNIDRYGFSYPGQKHVVSTFTMYPFFWGNKGAEMTRDGKVSFATGSDKESMLKTLNYLSSLIAEGCVTKDSPSLGFVEIESNFIGDQCAMAILGGWQYATIRENAGEEFADKVGIAPLPYPDENGVPVACAGGWNMAMFCKDPAKQEAAWKFMEFWTTSEVQKVLTLSGQMSTLKSLYESDADVMADKVLMDFYNILQNGKTRDKVGYQGMMDLQFQELLQAASMQMPEADLIAAIDKAAKNTIDEATKAGVYPQ